jgi:hypothetical protein
MEAAESSSRGLRTGKEELANTGSGICRSRELGDRDSAEGVSIRGSHHSARGPLVPTQN